MKPRIFLPLIIGILLGLILYKSVGWIYFMVIFPWIGLSISLGHVFQLFFKERMINIGRRITLLMIFPLLFILLPILNHENLQIEGIVFLILIGYFSKGIIHYAIAKVIGPFLFGRGFCGWACWTGAILELLPIHKHRPISPKLKNIRFATLFISLSIPLVAFFFLSYDIRRDYLNREELLWMMIGNGIYYLLAVPLAFMLKDRRAFCKVLCPVSLIMKIPAKFSLLKIQPTDNPCIRCGKCNQNCPMDIDVMSYISRRQKVTSTECILCGDCVISCPVKALR